MLAAVHTQEMDIFALTETWLSDSVNDAEIFDDRYMIFRKDRPTRGGGVLLAVRADRVLSATRIQRFDTRSDGEFIWVELSVDAGSGPAKRILFCVVYLPPSCPIAARDFFTMLDSEVEYLSNKNIVILGDFNAPSNGINGDIDVMCGVLDLHQCSSVTNERGCQLDLAFVSSQINSKNVRRSECAIVNEDCYHPAIEGILDLNNNTIDNDPSRTQLNTHLTMNECRNQLLNDWNFNEVDPIELNNCLLECDWNLMFECNDVDDALTYFYRNIAEVLDRIVPRRCTFIKRRTYPKWYSKELIRLITVKYFLHRKWRRTKLPEVYDEFSATRRSAKKLAISCHREYLAQCGRAIVQCPGQFWNFVNSKRQKQVRTPVLYHGHKALIGNGAIANGFANFFESVFDNESIPSSDWNGGESCPSTLLLSEIGEADLLYAFRKLKPTNSAGPDGIPCRVFKGWRSSLMIPLLFIFNLSLSTNSFPTIWKTTKVVPIFKKNDSTQVENYRPIAVLSAGAKLFEIILHRYLQGHCGRLLRDHQHGFRTGRSTVTNLISFSSHITTALDGNGQIDTVYGDFEKAFDKVNHGLLISKLSRFGVGENLIMLLSSYLQGRSQYVKYGGALSGAYPTCSGVPQGSNLGPLLFLLYIDDVHTMLASSRLLLFADDLKIYKEIRSLDDCAALQVDLDSLWCWSQRNLLPLSIPKCQVITFSRSRTPIVFPYTLDGTSLQRVSSVLDLGVTFESGWRFGVHIDKICAKASKALGFVFRFTREFPSSLVLRTLYDSLVRSQLEYASIVWNPTGPTQSLRLERVHKKYLRVLYMREFGYYPCMYPTKFLMGSLGCDSLRSRRIVYLGKHFYKLLRGGVDNPEILSSIGLWVPERSYPLRSRPLFRPIKARTRVLADAPISKAIALLNGLSEHLDLFHVDYSTLVEFMWNSVVNLE